MKPTYHDVHASQLRPDLHEYTDDGSIEHARTNELKVRGVLSFRLDFDPFSDFVEFADNEGTIGIAVTVSKSKDCASLLPTILGCQPAGRLREENHAEEKQDGWDHLESPGSTEGTSPIDERASVTDIEHYHDSPGNCPLLCADELSSLAWRSDLRDVDRDLSGTDANTEAVDYATDDEHGDVL